jgi:hypothetical protein
LDYRVTRSMPPYGWRTRIHTVFSAFRLLAFAFCIPVHPFANVCLRFPHPPLRRARRRRPRCS